MDIKFWASTDVGRVREHNEDNFLVDKRLRLFVVCDGMGGHAAGEVASAMCVKLVREALHEQRDLIEFVHIHPHDPVARQQLTDILEQALISASARVFEAALEDESKRGMGTTCCVLLLTNERGYIAHVGDSRIYLLRRDEIHQMTEDHSLYNEMVRMGKIRPGEHINLPNKNAVTRAVGVRDHVDVDVTDFELEVNDRILLCSDGLSGYFTSNEQIASMLSVKDIRTATEQCIDFAVEAGGKDNITAILVNINTTGSLSASTQAAQEALLATLKQSPIFDYLTQKELGHVSSLTTERTLHDGELLIAPGEELSDLSLIVHGEVVIKSQDMQPLKVLGVGEHIGDLGFVDAQDSPVYIYAKGMANLATISRTQILDLLRHDPELSVKILWNLLQVFATQLRDLPIELMVGAAMAPLAGAAFSPSSPHRLGPPSMEEEIPWESEGEDTKPPTTRPEVPSELHALSEPAESKELWGFEATRRGSLDEVTEHPTLPPEEDLRSTTEFNRSDIESMSAHRAALKEDAARAPLSSRPSTPRTQPPITPRAAVISSPKAARPVPPLKKGITGEGKTSASPKKKKTAPARSSRPSSNTSISGTSGSGDSPFGSRRPVSAPTSLGAAQSNPFDKPVAKPEPLPRDPLAKTMQLDADEFEQIKAAHKATLLKQTQKPDEQ